MKVGDLVWYGRFQCLALIVAEREPELDAFIIKSIETGLEQTLGRRFLELVE
tara:strand:- start:406 stop:561 length:156 start_codon:yes stop_codon:yes gene_type:complete